MKGFKGLVFAGATAALLLSGSALPGNAASTTVQQSAINATRNVIVILRDQMPGIPGTRGAREARRQAISSAQSPILAQLHQSGAQRVHSFGLLNAVSATVSLAEADSLAAQPLVQAVVPDAPIRLPRRSDRTGPTGAGSSGGGSAPDASQLCNTLEPQALQLTHTAYLDPKIPSAQQIVTGKGVKVAWIADGLDVNNPGFIRADGSHVFIDYQDFTGDPASTPTGGEEAFGDASSIAAQDQDGALTFDISQFVNPIHPLPSPCNIRIRGMAPGASLVGLNVYSNLGYTTTSTFVQAIEWAVNVDDVDVINESFGGNPYPDTNNDPITLADAAAVRAGVTVVVSTGDAGSMNTLGSPSTSAPVISSGATTQLRLYAQTGYPEPLLLQGGYVDNNIAAFSSGGVSNTGARTVDAVAPGDSGWALCSTDTVLFTECTNNNGEPSPVAQFGGTSESSPLTAGLAALVIEAYRKGHGGADPSPALVKEIIMSTATDLGAPSDQQGAGLIDSLKAVHAALSYRATPIGHGLLHSPNAVSITDDPNSSQSQSFTVTNTGTTTQHLTPSLQKLGPPIAGASLNLTLDPATDPTFPNSTGAQRSYITQTFAVPAGAQHLDAAIAWQIPTTEPSLIAYLSLIDPKGRMVIYSSPQGFSSGYGNVSVVSPMAGTWTAYIYTRPPGGAGSYSGPVQFSWAAENYVKFGSVAPSQLNLPPGASKTFTAQFRMPSQPGDLAAAVRFDDIGSEPAQSEIPVILRALVPTSRQGGFFSGTLTGGNARPGVGNVQTYAFDVPSGVNNMSVAVNVTDNGYVLEGLLIDPHGMVLSVEPNIDFTGAQTNAVQLFRSNPQPGRWQFLLLQDFYSSGNQTSLPFTTQIAFNSAQVSAPGLPRGARLKAGDTITVPVIITNTGQVNQLFFLDARLSALATTPLPTSQLCAAPTLPGTCSLFWVPTQVTGLGVAAQSSAPINMDTFPISGFNVGGTGSPDLFARPVAPKTVAASLNVPEVPFGPWEIVPGLIGPYGPQGAPTVAVATAAAALMQPFDTNTGSDTGDVWSELVTGVGGFSPVAVGPGATVTINLYITPTGAPGTTVSGYVYIDTFNPNVNTGDEVVRLPYSYRITK